METSPRNKMIKTSQENTKGAASTPDAPKRKKKFFFSVQQRTVEASSREEAEAIINKEK